MDTGLDLKKTIVSYSDTTENNFAVDIWKILKDTIKIKVMSDFFSNVDYELTSKKTGKVMYLELKCRDMKYSNVNSFIIGKSKIEEINSKRLTPCVLIWKFGNLIYFKLYTTDLLNYKVSIVQNGKVIFINKNECGTGMNDLTKLITEIIESL